ncbi:MAG: hypothetical protein ACMXYL_05245 [Candidatus Woesearchaeota archaeon]
MEKKRRRGQAALEFLMTYSWAILVVIIVIGALAYFGVLDPSNLIPERCVLEAGMDCVAFTATEGADDTEIVFEMVVRNGLGRPVEIIGVEWTPTAGDGGSCIAVDGITGDNLGSGQTSPPIESGPCDVINPGRKNSYNVVVEYQYADLPVTSRLNMTVSGEIFAQAR